MFSVPFLAMNHFPPFRSEQRPLYARLSGFAGLQNDQLDIGMVALP